MIEFEKLRALTVGEKLQLVEDLWDSIAEERGAIRLSASHRAELDRRLDRLEESPTEGTGWDAIKGRIPVPL